MRVVQEVAQSTHHTTPHLDLNLGSSVFFLFFVDAILAYVVHFIFLCFELSMFFVVVYMYIGTPPPLRLPAIGLLCSNQDQICLAEILGYIGFSARDGS